MLLEASLGFALDAPRRRIVFSRPKLPESMSFLAMERLQVADSLVDLVVERQAQNIHVEVLRKTGDVDVVVNQ
jgi:hypothetical protein